MSPLQILNQNILVLEELISSIKENRPADKTILNQYQGFGSIREILFDPNDNNMWAGKSGLRHSIQRVHELLTEVYSVDTKDKLITSIRSSSLTAFYTPKPIINAISTPIIDYFNKNNQQFSVLEPSSGKGDFIKPFINNLLLKNVSAIEKDPLTALIHSKLFEGTKVKTVQSGFEQYSNSSYEAKAKYDLVISNIPFGNIKIHDEIYSKRPKHSPEFLSQNQIHTYFFAKGIDKLNENGILAFITSSGISDSPSNEYLRKDMLTKCELIDAIRLPNNSFDTTKVVTDLIVLKKRPSPLKSLNELTSAEIKYLKTKSIKLSGDKGEIEQNINAYFVDEKGHPNENLIGYFEHGYLHDRPIITIGSDYSVDQISDNLKSKLESSFGSLVNTSKSNINLNPQQDLFGQLSLFDDFVQPQISTQKEKVFPEIQPISLNEALIEENNLIDGNVFVHNDIVGKIEFSANGPILVPLNNKYDSDKFRIASNVLLTYKRLLDADIHNAHIAPTLRSDLNRFYDQFESKYGPFSMKTNKDVCEIDVEGFKLKGLENYDYKISRFVKSDIFFNSLNQTELNQTVSLQDAIFKSLNHSGKLDIEYIAKHSGLTIEETVSAGLQDSLFFIDPYTNTNFNVKEEYTTLPTSIARFKYVTKDELLSGPVRFKIAELNAHKEKFFTSEDLFVKTVSLLQSVNVPELTISEIDVKLGESWIPTHHFINFAEHLLQVQVSIKQNYSNSAYSISIKGHSHQNSTEFAVKCKNGSILSGAKLLTEALHGSSPVITYSVKYADGSSQTFIDREAMSQAQMKIDTIHQRWKEFIINNDRVAKELSNIYNNTQNIDIERVFNGEHLIFPGLEKFDPYPHQKNGVYQILQQNGCLIDHVVGAGKTLLFCTASMEMKRLNISKKPMITALKANTKEIYRDFKIAYPNAKVLCPTDSDFTPANRLQFFQKIQNNNWDAIILTHEQFLKIPQSREVQLQVLNDEIRNLTLDLKEAEYSGLKVDKRVLKGLQTRIENKTAQVQRLTASINKDPYLLTFDKMGIDHLIVDESHEFKNLEFTTRHNRVAGLGSPEGSQRALNMLFAVRTLQKMHQGDKGITFCSGTPISNSLIELYLLKKYLCPSELAKRNMSNFDSWARSYAELSRDFEISITNQVQPKERFRSFQKVPELARWYRSFTNVANDNNIKLDKPELITNFVEIPATPTQNDYSAELIKAIQNENFSFFGKDMTQSQLNAKMLIATTISTKMSLDMRILEPSFDITEGSKLIDISDKIAQLYQSSEKYNGTQFVFCDTSTPSSQTAHIFNIYDGLKQELTNNYEIPENQIAFIHHYDTDKKRKELFSMVNEGKIRIVLGSTKKMGVGVNMQQRCVAMHHIDIPWTPKDIEQRDGRGARQGNQAAKLYQDNKVNKFVYATTGTLDAYRYYLVDTKQKFINQIKSSNITFRTIDEGDMGEDGSMSPAAFIARLSGKEELLEKNKLDKQISELELRKNVLLKEVKDLTNKIAYAQKMIPLVTCRMEHYQSDLISRNESFKLNENKPSYTFTTITGEKITDQEKISAYISEQLIKYDGKENKTIGHIGKFDISLNGVNLEAEGKWVTHTRLSIVSQVTEIEYIHGSGLLKEDQKGLLYRYPFDCIKNLEKKIDDQNRQINVFKEDIEKDKAMLEKTDPYQFDTLIEEKRFRSHELALIIEKDTNQIQEGLTITENLLTLIQEGKYSNAHELLKQLAPDQIPDIKSLIEGAEINEESKTKAKQELSNFIVLNHAQTDPFYQLIYSFESGNINIDHPVLLEYKQSGKELNNDHKLLVLNSKLDDEIKLTVLHVTNVKNPMNVITEHYSEKINNTSQNSSNSFNNLSRNQGL